MQKETERHHHIAIHCHTHYIILPAALTLSPESSFEEFDYSLSLERHQILSFDYYIAVLLVLLTTYPKKHVTYFDVSKL